jgi:hypothetical protein
LKAEDVDLSNDRELERAAFLVDRLSKKIIDVERVLLRHIEYEDSEYNVESLKASRIDYNRFLTYINK